MIITLAGYMGTGKTAIGKELAQLMRYPFIDLDEYIRENFGFPPGEIIEKFGEDFFRAVEHQALKSLLNRYRHKRLVLSLGGGTMTVDKNIKRIKDKTLSVFIDTDFDLIIHRLEQDKNHRPLLKKHKNGELDKERIYDHFLKRLPYYRQADISFKNDYENIRQAAEHLLISIKAYEQE
jgi:shikimate kinase